LPLYEIGGLKTWMEPQRDPLKTQAERYRIVGNESDCQIRAVYGEEEWEGIFAQYKRYPVGSVEYLKTGSLFYTKALSYGCFYLHSSAVVLDGFAYLFSAPSGTGKSTHTQNWLKIFGEERAFILNDDKPMIRCIDGEYRVYGTPFSGKTDQNRNTFAPLAGICFLERGEDNRIEPMPKGDVFPLLIRQTVYPPEESDMIRLLDLAERMIEEIPFYRLICTADEVSAEVSYRGMRRE